MNSSTRIFSLLLGLCAVTSGCATAPPEVKADVPLVHPSLMSAGSLANSTATSMPGVSHAVFNSLQTSVVTLEDDRYLISDHYVSALGNECRTLVLQAPPGNKAAHASRVVCKRNGEWQLLNPLVSAADEKDL